MSSVWKLGQDSFTKCLVWFADGNSRTFYSLDWTHRLSKNRDREIGLKRLRALIGKWGDKANIAIIYNTDNGEEVERYERGVKQHQL